MYNGNMVKSNRNHKEENGVKENECCGGAGVNKPAVNFIKSPYADEQNDVLIHLQLSNKFYDLKEMFGDVKFVCMGGTPQRMRGMAQLLREELGLEKKFGGTELQDLTAKGNRYSMFKVGPILCVNHGMGYPSINIILHELIKLMHYARAVDPIFVRTGTSGGIDIPNGTTVISTKALNDFVESFFEVPILGKRVKMPAVLDQNLAKELKASADATNLPAMLGATISAEHFYESTAMEIGAYCDYTDRDRKEYYNRLKEAGALNMDMEAIVLAAVTHKVGIKSAILNVVVNDAFLGSEDASPEVYKEWQQRPQKILINYMRSKLSL